MCCHWCDEETGIVAGVKEKGLCSLWCVEGHVLSLIVMRTHVLSLMWWGDRYCQWCDEKRYMFCHWCEEKSVITGVKKKACFHWCIEGHVLSLMCRRTCVVTDVMRRQVLSLVWSKRHMFSLMCRRTSVVTDVRRRHVSSLVRIKDIRCHRGDERHVLLLHASRISRQEG